MFLKLTITLGNKVFYRGTVSWNHLSQTVTEATSLSFFKKLYYKYIWFMYIAIVFLFACVYKLVVLHVFIFLVCCLYPGPHWKSILIYWVNSLFKYYNQLINQSRNGLTMQDYTSGGNILYLWSDLTLVSYPCGSLLI